MPTGVKESSREIALCVVCGNMAFFFCDYEEKPGVSCDAPLCPKCRVSFGILDYCPKHAEMVWREGK